MAASVSSVSNTLPFDQPPAVKTSEMASKQLAGDLQSFLKILTVQMQNQDPFNPTDSGEFVAQLVQFANIEQSIVHNKKLDALIDIQKGQQTIQAINFVGKDVKYNGEKFYYNGENTTPITLHLPQDIPNLNYTIVDDQGHFVLSQTVTAKAGPYKLNFGDNPDFQGRPLKPGEYHIQVSLLDKNSLPMVDKKDNRLICPVTAQGIVTRVEKVDKDPVLYIQNVAVPFNSIQSFSEKPMVYDSNTSNTTILPLPLAMEAAMR